MMTPEEIADYHRECSKYYGPSPTGFQSGVLLGLEIAHGNIPASQKPKSLVRPRNAPPTHRCRVCHAFWRIWLKNDTLMNEDAWTLCGSSIAAACCDNAYMGEQILPTTTEDMEEFLKTEGLTETPVRP